MSDTDTEVTDQQKRAIRDAVRNQPLGDRHGVQCSDCGGALQEQEQVKAYVVGDELGQRWKVAKVFHPNCGDLFDPENIGRNDDTEAIALGTLVHDPSVSAGGPDETQTTKTADATFIEAPRGEFRLEDPTIEAVAMMSQERLEERRETMQQAQELMEDIQSGEVDHPLGDLLRGAEDDDTRSQ